MGSYTLKDLNNFVGKGFSTNASLNETKIPQLTKGCTLFPSDVPTPTNGSRESTNAEDKVEDDDKKDNSFTELKTNQNEDHLKNGFGNNSLRKGRQPVRSVHVCDSQVTNIIDVRSKRFKKRLETL